MAFILWQTIVRGENEKGTEQMEKIVRKLIKLMVWHLYLFTCIANLTTHGVINIYLPHLIKLHSSFTRITAIFSLSLLCVVLFTLANRKKARKDFSFPYQFALDKNPFPVAN